MFDTPTPFSCDMCGNPRRRFSLKSLRELSADEAQKLELVATAEPRR